MYGVFTYIWDICRVNVGKYTSTMDDLGNLPILNVDDQVR